MTIDNVKLTVNYKKSTVNYKKSTVNYQLSTANLMLNQKKIFLVVLIFFIFRGGVFAQNQYIDIDVNGVDIEKLLDIISGKTGLKYSIECDYFSKRQKFYINSKKISVEEVLDQCLTNTNLSYKISDNTIIITSVTNIAKSDLITQNIKGVVRDIQSKEPLEGATIIILGSNPLRGTSSKKDGNYKLHSVPIGRYEVKVSYVGYKEVIIPEVTLHSTKELVLDVELEEVVEEIEQIIVETDKERPLNDMAFVSARSFRVEETKRYAASFGDPARMALCYAGVSTNDDYRNEIIVRGNSPQYLLWRIEGIEVPSPNHFTEGGLYGGGVSILSSNVVGRSDFLTGAFPADYGNAVSGVFDIFLRNGNSEKHEIGTQIGNLGIEATVEGPFIKSNNSSYLVNYRYSTLALFNKLRFSFAQENIPDYQDISYKINLPTKKLGRFSLWGVGGISYYSTDGVTDSTDWSPDIITFRKKWMDYMMAVGVSHVINPNSKSYIKSTLAMTKYGSTAFIDTLVIDKQFDNIAQKQLFNTSLNLSIIYNNKINKFVNFKTGTNIKRSIYNYLVDISSNYNPFLNNMNANGRSLLMNSFMQLKFKLNNFFSFNLGCNYMYYSLIKHNSLEPRFGFRFDLSQEQTISFGYGLHTRHELPAIYFKRYLINEDYKVQLDFISELPKSHHFVLSYANRFTKNLYLKLESYYQKISNYYIASDSAYTFSANNNYLDFSVPLSSNGFGRNYGIELTLERYFTNNYYFLVTSSLFKSEYKALNGLWYSTIYDLGYVHNVVGGKEFRFGNSKNKVVGLNCKVNWTGGKRDTPILLKSSVDAGHAIYDESARNNLQYSDYFRIDVGLNFKVNFSRFSHFFSVNVQNITNRRNMSKRYFDPNLNILQTYRQSGFIPVFNYRLEF